MIISITIVIFFIDKKTYMMYHILIFPFFDVFTPLCAIGKHSKTEYALIIRSFLAIGRFIKMLMTPHR